jgi:hypothetical protein
VKNTALVMVLMLCVCTAGAVAQAPAPISEADFLASLAAPQPVPAKAGSATKASCTVTLTCDVGGFFLSCTSPNGDCQSGPTWVKCDGIQQNCPICQASRSCCDGSFVQCFGWSSCSNTPFRCITCDGVIEGCCPPLSQCI